MAEPTEPIPGQDPGVTPEVIQSPEQTKDPMVAFGRFVKTEIYDVFGEMNFGNLTDADKQMVRPSVVGPQLFNAPFRHRGQVAVDKLALNPLEYKIMARWPRALGQAAITQTLGANDLSDARLEAAWRARLHVFADKRDAMTEHVGKMVERRSNINRLRRAVHAQGFARERLSNMKWLIAEAWQEGETILDVLHVQQAWDDEKRKQASTALVHYLTTGAQQTRISHWKDFTALTDSYLGARITLFKNRIFLVNQALPDDK